MVSIRSARIISGIAPNLKPYDFGTDLFSDGFGPVRLSRAKYSLTTCSVVTQFRPVLIPQISPRVTNRRRWLVESPLSLAAF